MHHFFSVIHHRHFFPQINDFKAEIFLVLSSLGICQGHGQVFGSKQKSNNEDARVEITITGCISSHGGKRT
jgi:hypothetical protein